MGSFGFPRKWELRRFATRSRANADFRCLAAKPRPMIEGRARFSLPLMDHLVNQRLERITPSVAPDVTPADRDFSRRRSHDRRIVSETTLHAPRYTHGDGRQRARKPFGVEPPVFLDQPGGPRLVIGMRTFAPLRVLAGPG